MKKPCSECPYRKDSLKGWLGEDSGNPEQFLQQLERVDIHPCHKTVDWESDNEFEVDDAPRCIGALQFMNNSLTKSKFPHILALQQSAGKNEEVLQFKHNFIKHHGG